MEHYQSGIFKVGIRSLHFGTALSASLEGNKITEPIDLISSTPKSYVVHLPGLSRLCRSYNELYNPVWV
jgi:hypothetical protein